MWVEASLGKLCSDSLQWGKGMAASQGLSWWEGTHTLLLQVLCLSFPLIPLPPTLQGSVFFLSLSFGLGKDGISLSKPPLHQHSDIIDSVSAHLEGRSLWGEREKQHCWCCSFPQPVTCEGGSHSHRNTVWRWQSLELQIPMRHYLHCQLLFTNTRVLSELTKAEFKPDTDKLCLICCCSFNDGSWLLMISHLHVLSPPPQLMSLKIWEGLKSINKTWYNFTPIVQWMK